MPNFSGPPTDKPNEPEINVPRSYNPSAGASLVPPGVGELNYIQMLLAGLVDQQLYTSSSPTFVGLTLSGLTASQLIGTSANKVLQSVSPGTSLSLSGTTLNTIQGIRTADSPTFTGLGIGSSLNGGYMQTIYGAPPSAGVPLSIKNTVSNEWSGIHFFSSGGTLSAHVGWGNSGAGTLANAGYSGCIANSPWHLTTNDTIRMTITAAGLVNVIGTASLGIPNPAQTFYMRFTCGSALTADRVLTITPGDAARTITLNGNPTLDDWFDQAVKAASDVTHGSLIASNLTASVPVVSDANKKLVSQTYADFMASLGIGQAWTSVSFNAADFTGTGSMTASVDEADVTVFAYTLIGKIMIVTLYVGPFTLGGTASYGIKVKIPASKTAAKAGRTGAHVWDNSIPTNGYISTSAGDTYLYFYKTDVSNWTLGTNVCYVVGTVVFETQ